MNELIPVATGGQGLLVESVRVLYDFLGFDTSQWNRWARKNIVNNSYARGGVDYRLTIDFAKRLSTLARTGKGEEIRRYFLDCESSQTPSQLQLVSRLANLEKLVSQLLEREQIRLQTDPPVHQFPMAIETTRAKVARMVIQYAERSQMAYYAVWNLVYNQLHLHYGFNVRAQRKSNYENLLDVAERFGQMERIHAIVTSEFALLDE